MASASPPLNPRNPRKWLYTYEALPHIPTLRLFLFHSDFDPSASSLHGLAADLRLDQSLLLVTWCQSQARDAGTVLRVPVPRVLIDVGAPVECAVREDHIEVKFSLVVPVDHDISVSFRHALAVECVGRDREVDRPQPLALGSDFESLFGEEVHFYCNTCSTRLTRRCLRNFVEMPSANWREVADNWFGTCCCSFGGVSEKLVAKYIDGYACTSGTCLLDVASVVVCRDDLEFYFGGEVGNEDMNNMTHFVSENEKNTMEEHIVCEGEVLSNGCTSQRMDGNPGVSGFWHHGKMVVEETGKELGHNDERALSVWLMHAGDNNAKQTVHSLREGDCFDITVDVNLHSGNLEKPSPDCHCCPADRPSSQEPSERQSDVKLKFQTKKSAFHNLSLNGSFGDGFLIKHPNLAKEIKWVDFVCKECSSLLGSYPSNYEKVAPVDEGIRLFKCSISTSIPVGGRQDKFRKYTLEKVFTNLLLESAVDELSYRTVIRDMITKSPMLKLILLNSSVWCFTGYCYENNAVEPILGIDLQPFAKVLYADCSSASEDSLSVLKNWSVKNHADEVYMLPRQIQKLTEVLTSWKSTLPLSCSSLQGMSLTFIHR